MRLAVVDRPTARLPVFLLPQFRLEVLVKVFPEQAKTPHGDMSRAHAAYAGGRDGDRARRLPSAAGVVCPGCGARIGKPCVATVPFLGFGAIGMPIEGVHVERIAAAHEQGVA